MRKVYPHAKVGWEGNNLVIFHQFFTRKNRYVVKMVYPEGFPYDHPRVYVVNPIIYNAPHRYPDGALSIHFVPDGPHISGKMTFDGAKKWLEAFERWRTTGHWPERW